MSKQFFESTQQVVDNHQSKQSSYEPDSLAVKLSTAGKLDAPPVLHVSDYRMDDALRLAMADETEIVDHLVDVLQHRVQEDFDVKKLHEKEMEEILLTIHANYWSGIMRNMPFPWTEKDLENVSEEKAQKIRDHEDIPRVDIDLGTVQIDPLAEEFEEPIRIQDRDGTVVRFRLPRVESYLVASKHVKDIFATEDKKFEDVDMQVRQAARVGKRADNVDAATLDAYKKYQERRTEEYLRAQQAQALFSYNDHQLTTFEEQLEAYSKVSLRIWRAFNNILEKYRFGVNQNVKVKSPLSKKPVTRRFQFRIVDYIPTDEVSDDSGLDISFGDGS